MYIVSSEFIYINNCKKTNVIYCRLYTTSKCNETRATKEIVVTEC